MCRIFYIYKSVKSLLILYPCIVLVSLLSSCEDKTVDYGLDVYYVNIATAQNANEFLLDNGETVIAKNFDKNAKTYAFGDRVILNYTVLSPGDNNVRINGSVKVPLGKITLANDSAIHSAPKEPIILESAWLGSHYLNMQFYFDYMFETHKIGLLVDSTRLDSDTLRMYFVHDTNNDPPGYPVHSYLSFDLKDLLGDPGKSRPISVQINTTYSGTMNYGFEY